MKSVAEIVAVEVSIHYVGAAWVAEYYNVSRQQVYRAAQAGRLPSVVIRNAHSLLTLFDTRNLPKEFPRG